ncbi:MAG: YgiT-type zinc finger protein [Acidobacteriota bacterium]
MLKLKTCPTCGSNKIKKIRKDLTERHNGVAYVVPDIEYYECPSCGERVYDRNAMRKIEFHSPAFQRTQPRKRKLA